MSNDVRVDLDKIQKELDDSVTMPGLADMTDLGNIANELIEITAEISRLESKKREMKARIMRILDGSGLEAAIAGGRRIGFTTRVFWGVAEGQTPKERQENIQHLHEWLEKVAPEVNVPASTNINKAVAAFVEQGGDPESLPFLRKSETRSLTNRKA